MNLKSKKNKNEKLSFIAYLFCFVMLCTACTSTLLKLNNALFSLAKNEDVISTTYKFNPIAGAGMQVFNLLSDHFKFEQKIDDMLSNRIHHDVCGFSSRGMNGFKKFTPKREQMMNSNNESSGKELMTIFYQSQDANTAFAITCSRSKGQSLQKIVEDEMKGLLNIVNDYKTLG